MMKKNKTFIIPLFIFIILVLPVVFATDEYGNELDQIWIYEVVGSDNNLIYTNTTNPNGQNITITGKYDLIFNGYTNINKTFQPVYNQVENTTALGLQLFGDGDTDFQNPMTIIKPFTFTDGYWNMPFVSLVELDTDLEITSFAVGNITHWVNYHNGSDWLLEDSWIFNLVVQDEYTPPDYGNGNDEFNLSWIFLLGTFVCGAVFPLCFVGAVKLNNSLYVGYGILSFIGFICFLGMLTGLKII